MEAFADNADQLRVRVQREDSVDFFTTVKDTVLAIDAESGQAAATLNVVLFTSPQRFRILLDAIRSSDGVVLFSGVQIISVAATPPSGTPPTFDIPVTYAGPTGTSILVSPRDTAVAPGVTFPLVAVVRDAAEAVVAVPVTFALANPADSTILQVGRLTGLVTTRIGAQGETRVGAKSADGLTDPARIFVGSTPASVRVTPGFAALLSGATLQLAGDVLDGGGNVLSGFAVSWAARAPAVAAVSATGLVSATGIGSATVVATSGAFADSTQVVVPPAGNVVASAIAGRFFGTARAGDTVIVDLTADMQFSGGELLGSFNATLLFNPAVLQYVSTQSGTFGSPTVNAANVGVGELRLGHANAAGAGGQVLVARVRFVAVASGSGALGLTFSEMSAALTFTNLISRLTVAAGAVAVVP